MEKKQFELKENEQLFAGNIKGDCWKMPSMIGSRQVAGRYYFTNQRVIFLASGLIGTGRRSWEIEFKDISTVKTCTTPPCFPFGILITMKNGDKYKLSLLKRKKYFEWISKYTA